MSKAAGQQVSPQSSSQCNIDATKQGTGLGDNGSCLMAAAKLTVLLRVSWRLVWKAIW